MKIKKEFLVLFFILVIFVGLFHINISSNLGYDQSRHANQGVFFYKYFSNILQGNFMGVESFMEAYNEKQAIGFYVLHDPPLHAIAQSFFFLIAGPNEYASKLPSMFFFVIGSIFLYLISKKVFNNKLLAYCTVILCSLIPYIFLFNRDSMVDTSVSYIFLGWFYFTFIKGSKRIAININNKKVSLGSISIFIGGIFLALAFLIRYQSIIFAAAFILAYAIFLFIRKHQPFKLIKEFIIQLVITFIITLPWVWFSLIKFETYKQLLWQGVSEGRGSGLAWLFHFPIQLTFETFFLALFALIPFILFFKKKDSFISENKEMVFLVLTIIILSTFLISNRQLRYIMHVIPFVALFTVKGMHIFFSWLGKKINLKSLFMIFFILITIFLLLLNIGFTSVIKHAKGDINRDAFEYVSTAAGPIFLVNLECCYDSGDFIHEKPQIAAISLTKSLIAKMKGENKDSMPIFNTAAELKQYKKAKLEENRYSVSYIKFDPSRPQFQYSPDSFMFNTFILEEESEPKKVRTYSRFIPGAYLNPFLANDLPGLVEISSQAKVFVFIANKGREIETPAKIDEALSSYGFIKRDFTDYTVYEK